MPTFNDIQSAAERIAPFIHHTPVLTSKSINVLTGCHLFFKCENFQKTGSFKIRGASNAIFSLSAEVLKNGVITHSSGNHGAAVAKAAAWRDTKCYVVVPKNSPQFKKNALLSYGAQVTYSDVLLTSRIAFTEKIIKETGAVFIHPYDDEQVIAGAGTTALELIDEIQDLDFMFVPVGGGGGISGAAITAKNRLPHIKVIGAEPVLADDAYQSFISNVLQKQKEPKTIADGLRTALSMRTFKIIKQYVDEIVLLSDAEIIDAMRLLWERMKILVEPSSAITLAAVLKKKESLKNSKVGIIISGGNVDLKEILSLF